MKQLKKWTDQDLFDAFNAARKFNNDYAEDNGFTYLDAETYLIEMEKWNKHLKKVDKYQKEQSKTMRKLWKLKDDLDI